LPNGRIPLREPPCPGRQVGEGVSPTLDADHIIVARWFDFQGAVRQQLNVHSGSMVDREQLDRIEHRLGIVQTLVETVTRKVAKWHANKTI
jgi:hypothetical protein